MKKGTIIIWSLVAVLITVITYLITELLKVQKAPMTPAGVKFKSGSFTKLDLIAYFKLINPGSATITLSNQEYDVYINGRFVTHMKYSNPTTIKPGVNIMPLEINANLGDVIKAGWGNLGDILTNKNNINISINGSYTLRIGFLSFKQVALNQTFNLGSMTQAA